MLTQREAARLRECLDVFAMIAKQFFAEEDEAMSKAVVVGKWVGTIDAAAQQMDAQLRARVRDLMGPCDRQDFVDRYAAEHRKQFGHDFTIAHN